MPSKIELSCKLVIKILVVFCSESFKNHLKILSEVLVSGLIKVLPFEAFSEFCLLKMKFAKDTKIYFYKSKEETETNQTMTVHMVGKF